MFVICSEVPHFPNHAFRARSRISDLSLYLSTWPFFLTVVQVKKSYTNKPASTLLSLVSSEHSVLRAGNVSSRYKVRGQPVNAAVHMSSEFDCYNAFSANRLETTAFSVLNAGPPDSSAHRRLNARAPGLVSCLPSLGHIISVPTSPHDI